MSAVIAVPMVLVLIAAWVLLYVHAGQPNVAVGGAIFGLSAYGLGFSTQRGSR
jgi:hypothetical protein